MPVQCLITYHVLADHKQICNAFVPLSGELVDPSQLGLLGLGLPGAEGLSPYTNPALRTVFEPGAARALAEARHADEAGYERLSEVQCARCHFVCCGRETARNSSHQPL